MCWSPLSKRALRHLPLIPLKTARFFSFTWPVFAALRFDLDDIGIQFGAGPAVRLTYITVGDMHELYVEPVAHGHAEVSFAIAKGMRVALRPFVNCGLTSAQLYSFELTQSANEATILTQRGRVELLLEMGLSLGLQWNY